MRESLTRMAAVSIAGLLVASMALAQSDGQPAAGGQPATGGKPPVSAASRNLPSRFAGRAGMYYKAVWGIDSLNVKWVESGEMVRFTWRVLEPDKASALNDKKLEPTLIDPRAGVSLSVPVMEKVGQLRQSAPPEAGRSYWMTFSNKGRPVRRGDRVSVHIGPFHAENLVVD